MKAKTQHDPAAGFEIRLEEQSCGSERSSFENLFLGAVDVSLSMLGCAAKQTLYLELKRKFGLSKANIPWDVPLLSDALSAIFGQGAVLLEMKIMQELHRQAPDFRYYPNDGNLSFVDYVVALRGFCLK